MLHFDNGTRMVEDASELPDLRNAQRVFCDFETTSGDPKKRSVNPWRDCDVAGTAITVDDCPHAWYVPVNHKHGARVNRQAHNQWLRDTLSTASEWVNHSVKYDAHVAANSCGYVHAGPLVCTLTRAKIIDSDRMFRGGYGLDALSLAWLKEDISQYEHAMQPYLLRNKDYGGIPADIIASYGGQDALTCRRLWKYEEARCHADCRPVWETETALTEVLFRMERHGMRVNPQKLMVREMLALNEMAQIDEELTKIVGRSFRPHVNEDCFDVLCNQYGLPVLRWTEEPDEETGEQAGNPSFDKYAMAAYAAHPFAPRRVVELMTRYRKLNTFITLFLRKYQELEVDGVLHPTYNQCVRTGRMSCGDPNAQQLDKEAKSLIIPPAGCAFLSMDYSQIEFRTIVHYIRDATAIAAYERDPDTDFHLWVAEMTGMARKPAKTVNFMVAFGGGKKKTQKMLAANSDVVGDIKSRVDALVDSGRITDDQRLATFETLCEQKAAQVYDGYHSRLPGIKLTSRRAREALLERGYVRNVRGRHRHLPDDKAHLAFPSLNQSSAADIMKERTVALDKALRGTPLHLTASVHDETLIDGPIEAIEDPRTIRAVASVLERPDVELLVPIRCAHGTSRENWREASAGENRVPPSEIGFSDFSHIGGR